MDVVKVINVRPDDGTGIPNVINARYGGTPYLIPNDGIERIIPVAAAKLYFGDWDARDDDPNDRQRGAERQKLDMMYGLFDAPWYSHIPAVTQGIVDAGEPVDPYTSTHPAALELDARRQFIHPNLPQIILLTPEGDRIITVIDDPEGDILPSGKSKIQAQVDRADVKMMEQAIAKQQQQINLLIETMAKTDPAKAAQFADQHNSPNRANLPSAVPTRNLDVGLNGGGGDETAVDDAMSVMNDALGYVDPEASDTPADDPAPSPARKKAANRKAMTDA